MANTNWIIFLKELGWTQATLSRKLGVHRNAVGRWRKEGLPQYAQAYVDLALKMKRLKEQMEP